MAKYFVRDTHGFVTVVEAETCAAIQGTFEFRNDKGMTLVASFPIHSTISVVEVDKAWQDIFLNEEPPEEEPASCCQAEEESGTCLDCLVEDLLNSEKFIAGIAEIAADVVDEYFEPGAEQENPVKAADPQEPVSPPKLTVLKAVYKTTGEDHYGFLVSEKEFVTFGDDEEVAKIGLYQHIAGDCRCWTTIPADEFTFSSPETTPTVDKIPVLTVLKGVSKVNGERILGFLTPDNKLVNYFPGEENFVLDGIEFYKNGERHWHYVDPDDYCLSEVKNG